MLSTRNAYVPPSNAVDTARVMATSSETFFIVLAVVLCSILFCFTIGIFMILRCCECHDFYFDELPSIVVEVKIDSG
ncbi:hypothetical protein KIN20_033942 [Parelaphostrongylus tenuis]|uniref:Uncharacterized protein n=1 Tax=Parelaphostrongylus tenuis TaxID=148309 RepID=A0AAD5R9I8_PARTN|nr:hypothetical protein KIN20_033942 [Parelaphostrongylus tenuis]